MLGTLPGGGGAADLVHGVQRYNYSSCPHCPCPPSHHYDNIAGPRPRADAASPRGDAGGSGHHSAVSDCVGQF